jgi:hypothetical protein
MWVYKLSFPIVVLLPELRPVPFQINNNLETIHFYHTKQCNECGNCLCT